MIEKEYRKDGTEQTDIPPCEEFGSDLRYHHFIMKKKGLQTNLKC